MIYFKFPFDEQLYSTDENSNTNSINFHSFNNAERIDIAGKVIKKDLSEFENLEISSQILPEDETQFIAETQEEYLQKLEEVIKIIKENNLPKLVLSRRKIFKNFTEINLKESFNNLCRNYPNAFKYLFFDGETSWMGAFSEVLGKFNKSTHEFETMSIAGTIPVSEEWTEKEIEEQKPVSSYIRNTLTKYATLSEVQESETYDHISGNIKHLKTDFKIKINPEDLDSIIQELHPTPAVCGIPKDFCREVIEKVEKFPRELYAGYIKIETEDYIQYFVNLRCARLYKNSVHLFVGGGITAQSNPEKEWQETELKSEAVLKNLVVI
ncbi:chorismate-binding protein [Chryseobacterium indoltheticum]|uniref:Menaquinone-specific isochorismate synthase n=1 Tax=Chryseobacterium indoltheticum TaxID=254 RepID=A0A381FI54_9FLAO|nr:chorismate-binding protein [Chryseobacterium indoltheticum]SUX46216.1 Menaquinone-specific isochorismate synthase [Chryseobacterium indoltheticum]